MYLRETSAVPGFMPRNFKTRNIRPAQMLEAFQRSGKPIMELIFTRYEYSSAQSCRSTFANSISRMHLDHIHVITRNGHVYLYNDLAMPDGGAE